MNRLLDCRIFHQKKKIYSNITKNHKHVPVPWHRKIFVAQHNVLYRIENKLPEIFKPKLRNSYLKDLDKCSIQIFKVRIHLKHLNFVFLYFFFLIRKTFTNISLNDTYS